MVNKLGNNRDIDLVIVGTHGSSGLSTFLLGNHSRQMIDEINKPLLLVPPATPITRIKKIAFATDFKNLVKDMECLHQLIELARPLNAEILITHILNEDQHTTAFQYIIDQFMTEISGKANYQKLYYRELKSPGSVAGLDWLCKHGDIDMLAMVHRPHNFIDRMFRGSQTQKMAGHIPVPLLVFPA